MIVIQLEREHLVFVTGLAQLGQVDVLTGGIGRTSDFHFGSVSASDWTATASSADEDRASRRRQTSEPKHCGSSIVAQPLPWVLPATHVVDTSNSWQSF